MAENQYPPSGSLFTNEQKRNENSPDYSGYLEIDYEVLDDLIKQRQSGLTSPIDQAVLLPLPSSIYP